MNAQTKRLKLNIIKNNIDAAITKGVDNNGHYFSSLFATPLSTGESTRYKITSKCYLTDDQFIFEDEKFYEPEIKGKYVIDIDDILEITNNTIVFAFKTNTWNLVELKFS